MQGGKDETSIPVRGVELFHQEVGYIFGAAIECFWTPTCLLVGKTDGNGDGDGDVECGAEEHDERDGKAVAR